MAFTWQTSIALTCGLLAALLLSSAVVASPRPSPSSPAPVKDQSVIIGSIGYQDRLLLRETAYKEGFWMIEKKADIVYPKKNEVGHTISCIKVLDQLRDGTNGAVKVKHGGLGWKEVLLRFHSKRGAGINYLVEIWGH